jgi:transposase
VTAFGTGYFPTEGKQRRRARPSIERNPDHGNTQSREESNRSETSDFLRVAKFSDPKFRDFFDPARKTATDQAGERARQANRWLNKALELAGPISWLC